MVICEEHLNESTQKLLELGRALWYGGGLRLGK